MGSEGDPQSGGLRQSWWRGLSQKTRFSEDHVHRTLYRQNGQPTQEEIDKADRNGDGLICYKVVNGFNVILMETLMF